MSYDVPWRVVPIMTWPAALTRNRSRSKFSASWTATMDLLHRELRSANSNQRGAK